MLALADIIRRYSGGNLGIRAGLESDKAAGEVQNAIGGLKDAVRGK